jgi:hypothetical protein
LTSGLRIRLRVSDFNAGCKFASVKTSTAAWCAAEDRMRPPSRADYTARANVPRPTATVVARSEISVTVHTRDAAHPGRDFAHHRAIIEIEPATRH